MEQRDTSDISNNVTHACNSCHNNNGNHTNNSCHSNNVHHSNHRYHNNQQLKKRPRTAFTPEQIKRLEDEFQKNKYLSVGKRLELSKALKLTETQVCTLLL